MSLLSDIEASIHKTGPQCGIGILLEDLPVEDAAELRTALDNRRYPGTAIAKILTARGHKIPGDTVQRHRRGNCACP